MATMTVFGAVAVAAPARVRAQWPARSPMQARPARVGRSAGRVSLVPRAAKKSAPKAPVEQPTEAAPVEAPTTPLLLPPCLLPRATFLLVRPPSAARFRTHRHAIATRPDPTPRVPLAVHPSSTLTHPLSAPPPRSPSPHAPHRGRFRPVPAVPGLPPQGYPSYPPPKSSSSGPRGGCSSASAWRSPWVA